MLLIKETWILNIWPLLIAINRISKWYGRYINYYMLICSMYLFFAGNAQLE